MYMFISRMLVFRGFRSSGMAYSVRLTMFLAATVWSLNNGNSPRKDIHSRKNFLIYTSYKKHRPLKMVVWKLLSFLGNPIFRCYVHFREGTFHAISLYSGRFCLVCFCGLVVGRLKGHDLIHMTW